MDRQAVVNTNLTKSDNILGYKILDRLGAGGYGEVWKVEAPGGITKALKILYGFHDERKAMAELKALDKIKQLRHPFLLSLERIEVYNDQLVVVTELADRCLADLFNDYTARGAVGIPRDELLEYMKQAAEALDFIATEHHLQHLDVKPENLLLVGKHVKLADFGLVKSLQDVTQSLMGGLTPAYAAPELFDGRPSLYSDQYSLAIVYQEMLTGERCFDGNTPAQLAAQHMHGQPKLASLTKGDQQTMTRALAKKPEMRYKSCRAFVDELISRRTMAFEKKRTNIPSRSELHGTAAVTDPSRVGRARTNDATHCLSSKTLARTRNQVAFADPPERISDLHEQLPTLFVGLGKTGIRVCQKLKDRCLAAWPEFGETSSIRMLAIDTDRSELASAACGEMGSVLDTREMLALPLRKPEEYRHRAHRHSSWLHRRWIYAVPKSLQTEGLRPLGRLALVDHADDVIRRLEETITEMVKPEKIAEATERLNVTFNPKKVRVVLVGAISGGVASGVALDLAYILKVILGQSGLPADTIHGVFVHGVQTRERDQGLCLANSLSFMAELRYFTQSGFPGDASYGIPPLPSDLPINHPYFVEIGENLSALEWEAQIDRIADYLYLSSLTKASRFVDACRELENDWEQFSLRSFGVASCGLTVENLQTLSQCVTQAVVDRWLGKVAPAQSAQLTLPALPTRWQPAVIQDLAAETYDEIVPPSKIRNAGETVASEWRRRGQADLASLNDYCQLLGKTPERTDPAQMLLAPEESEVMRHLRVPLKPFVASLNQELAALLKSVWQGSRVSFKQFQDLHKQVKETLEKYRDEATQQSRHSSQQVEQLRRQILALAAPKRRNEPEPDWSAFAAELAQHIKRYCIWDYLTQFYQAFLRHLTSEVEPVERARIQLASHAQKIKAPALTEFELQLTGIDKLVIKKLIQDLTQVVDSVELRFYQDSVARPSGYLDVLVNPQINYGSLFSRIQVAAQKQLVAYGRNINFDRLLIEAAEKDAQGTADQMTRILQRANPMLDECGGRARLMVALPEFTPTAMIGESLARFANVRLDVERATLGNFSVMAETEDVAFADLVYRLAEKRLDSLEIAKRIHTRHDVEWSGLEDII